MSIITDELLASSGAQAAKQSECVKLEIASAACACFLMFDAIAFYVCAQLSTSTTTFSRQRRERGQRDKKTTGKKGVKPKDMVTP
jgi:dipeptide/tripeptide permease